VLSRRQENAGQNKEENRPCRLPGKEGQGIGEACPTVGKDSGWRVVQGLEGKPLEDCANARGIEGQGHKGAREHEYGRVLRVHDASARLEGEDRKAGHEVDKKVEEEGDRDRRDEENDIDEVGEAGAREREGKNEGGKAHDGAVHKTVTDRFGEQCGHQVLRPAEGAENVAARDQTAQAPVHRSLYDARETHRDADVEVRPLEADSPDIAPGRSREDGFPEEVSNDQVDDRARKAEEEVPPIREGRLDLVADCPEIGFSPHPSAPS